MKKFTAMDKLLAAVSGQGLTSTAVENQVNRIKQRLAAGKDEEGRSFAPYKDGRQGIPLSTANRLLDGIRYETTPSSEGFHEVAELRGEPATILVQQDKLRNFNGWGRDDKELASEDLAADIFRAIKEDH